MPTGPLPSWGTWAPLPPPASDLSAGSPLIDPSALLVCRRAAAASSPVRSTPMRWCTLAALACLLGGDRLHAEESLPHAPGPPTPLLRLGATGFRHAGPVRAVAWLPGRGAGLGRGGRDLAGLGCPLGPPAAAPDRLTLGRLLPGGVPERGPSALRIAPDGEVLASGGGHAGDSSLRLWSLTTGRALGQLPGHPQGVMDLACSPGGSWPRPATPSGASGIQVTGRPSGIRAPADLALLLAG